MSKTSKYFNTLLAFAFALTMAVVLVACGGNNQASESASDAATETETVTEEVADEAEKEETGEATQNAVFGEEIIEEVSNMVRPVSGTNDNGLIYYYAENSGPMRDIGIMFNPATTEYASYVGAVVEPLNNYVRVVDDATGDTLFYQIISKDEDGTVSAFVSNGIGNVIFTPCDINEILDVMNAINDHGVPMNIENKEPEQFEAEKLIAYKGYTGKGAEVYFAESEDDGKAIMIYSEPMGKNCMTFVGDITRPSDNQVKIVDTVSGLSIEFEFVAGDDDTATIDFGDEKVGTANLEKCPAEDVLDALDHIDATGKLVS